MSMERSAAVAVNDNAHGQQRVFDTRLDSHEGHKQNDRAARKLSVAVFVHDVVSAWERP